MLANAKVPVVGFAAYSGSGKTTLLTRLIPLLREAGLRVAVVKHAHHRFNIDHPGKDTDRFREAGAGQVLIGSRFRLALMMELEQQRAEPDLNELLGLLDQSRLDLVLVEGFKHEAIPKIEVHRAATGKALLYPDDPDIVALATDRPPSPRPDLPVLDLNRPEQVARLILDQLVGPPPRRCPPRP